MRRGRRRAFPGIPGLGRRRGLPALIAAVLAALIIAWREGAFDDPARPPRGTPEAGSAARGVFRERVAEVEDGDTIRLESGRQVRYLGIDTPEQGEPLAAAAREENRRLVEAMTVEVRAEGLEERDRYGRTLAVVWTLGREGEPSCVNVALVRSGLGWVYQVAFDSVPPEALRALLEAQSTAIAARRGVWEAWLGQGPRRRLVSTRLRLHAETCAELPQGAREAVSSLESELRAGKSPCRKCKPFARP